MLHVLRITLAALLLGGCVGDTPNGDDASTNGNVAAEAAVDASDDVAFDAAPEIGDAASCTPDANFCIGDLLQKCNAQGTASSLVTDCTTLGEKCVNAECELDGLVAHWKFDEGTGTVAKDSSSTHADATVIGATWTVGKYGGALSFSGSGTYVDAGDVLNNLTLPITAMMWVNMPDNGNGGFGLFSSDDGSTNTAGWSVQTAFGPADGGLANGLVFARYGDDTCNCLAGRRVGAGPILGTGKWQHLAFVIQGPSNMTFYRDGVGLSATSYSGTGGTMKSNASPFRIGVDGAGYFVGSIDDVRVYSRALSQTEIQTAMAN